jgi:PEGA domain
MTRPRSAWSGISTAIVVAAWWLWVASPVAAQGRTRDGGESTGSAAVPVAPPPPAPAPVASPPPATPSSSGGSSDSGSSASGGQTRSGGGGRTDRGAGGVRTGTATPRGTGSRTADARPGSETSGKGSTTNGRTRDGGEVVGTAVPRTSTPGGGGGGNVIIVPGGWYGFYPWAYGGLGFGGYYGYYGGYEDPWFGGYSSYSSSAAADGALRIKVKPREASVYVDGYFAGQVDDFDGVFQRLHLGPGPHRIEIREPKYETLSFDVQIDPDHTVTYRGELQKIL